MPIYKFRLAGPPHQSDDIAKSVQVDFHHTQIQMIERAAILTPPKIHEAGAPKGAARVIPFIK